LQNHALNEIHVASTRLESRRMRAASSLAILALSLGLASQGVLARPAASTGPHLRSSAMLVMDEASSSVLLARNAGKPAPIASITKLMTALVVLEGGQRLDESIAITAADREPGGGSRLAVGARLTRGELLHLALMSSENRAAHALGRNYPGGVPAVVAAMNRKAVALGMRHTRFVDPTGLSSRNVASPEDLVRLVNAAGRNATISDYSTDVAQTVRVGRQALEFRNTNTLVRDPSWDILVQKTGYIAEAGRCLVLKARVEGRTLVMVLLDSYGKYSRFADARRVRKWLEAQAAAHVAPPMQAVVAVAGS
jgi:D-alanyl-D-alanine endopeptidase (penicillin-binding protein 7)